MKLRGKAVGWGNSYEGLLGQMKKASSGTGFGWNRFTVFLCLFALLLAFSFMPTLSLPFLSLIAFPLPTLSLNQSGGGAVAYVRDGAASAKQLSNALGRRLPVAGQEQEKPFFILFFNVLNVGLLDFGIMQEKQEKKGL